MIERCDEARNLAMEQIDVRRINENKRISAREPATITNQEFSGLYFVWDRLIQRWD